MSKTLSRIFQFPAVLVFALAGAIPGAHAAALPMSVGTIQSAIAGNTTTVQYRWHGGGWHGGGWHGYGWHRGYGWGWGWPYYGAAVATGALIGAAAAAPYYYGPGYYDAPGYYPAPPPAAGGPARQCWVETDSRGYGYWQPC